MEGLWLLHVLFFLQSGNTEKFKKYKGKFQNSSTYAFSQMAKKGMYDFTMSAHRIFRPTYNIQEWDLLIHVTKSDCVP